MISVIIPFRADASDPACQHRVRLADWVVRRWESILPGAEIVFGHDDGEIFNRGRARNLGFLDSSGEIVVFADADTACSAEKILEAIHEVEHEAPWVLPYQTYYNMTEEDTDVLLRQDPGDLLPEPQRWEHRLTDAISGVFVMRREAFEAVNGYEQGFIGWGAEDRVLQHSLDVIVGRHRRLPGFVCHLWHPRGDADFTQPNWEHNRRLYEKYRRVTDPQKMKELRFR